MKANNALLAFFLFFLLFGLITAEYIYDSDGDILNNGGAYYIRPQGYFAVVEGASIGKSTSDESCSLAVVEAPALFSNGWPTKLTTTYPLNHITNDYPLNISFVSLPSQDCTDTPNWVVARINDFLGVAPVMVGKFEEFGNPISGYFYIKPDKSHKDYYKFAFCYSTSFCGYVILKTDSEGNQRLAVSSDRSLQPFLFKFAKAPSHDVVSGISMVV